MALQKYYLNTEADQTKTLKSDAIGLIFNSFIYNLNSTNGNLKLYLEDDNGNDIILFEDTVSSKQRIYFEEKYNLNSDDIKVYSDIDDIQVVVQVLNDN